MEWRHELHGGDRRREGRQRGPGSDRRQAQARFRRNVTWPPAIDASTRPSETTVMSHSLPGRSVPASPSIHAALAAPDGEGRIAAAVLLDTAGSATALAG